MKNLYLLFGFFLSFFYQLSLFSQAITEHEEHSQILIDSIINAEDELIITSPFISNNAIENDSLHILMKEAFLQRGVRIIVYTDKNFDVNLNGVMKNYANKGRKLLRDSFVDLRVVPKIHSKIIIKDRDLLVVGSYNWLSASRSSSSIYRNLEMSTVLVDDLASLNIDKIKATLDSLVVVEDAERNFCVSLRNAYLSWNSFRQFYREYKTEHIDHLMCCLCQHLKSSDLILKVAKFLSKKDRLISKLDDKSLMILFDIFKSSFSEEAKDVNDLKTLLQKITKPSLSESLESLEIAS